MKNHDFFMVFRGHIVSDITGDTSSDQGKLFGTFLMKIFFIRNVPNNIPWLLKVSPVMPETIFPRKTVKKHDFSCLLTTVGIPIVNVCTAASIYRNARFFLRGRGAGSKQL